MKKQFTYLSVIRKSRILVLLMLLFMCSAGRSQQNVLTIVGNPAGAPSEMKFSELKSVLMGEKQKWENGKRVIIALMKTNTDVGKTTTSKIYDMTSDELNKYWLALVFQGKAQAPKFFNTKQELEAYVAQNPGAIGVIDQPLASSDIRVITIDGKSQLNLSQ